MRVDAGLVGEGVVADQGLPDGDRDAAQPFNELGQLVESGDVDPRVEAVQGLEREDELLEARVAGPFSEAVDAGVGHLHAFFDRGEAVRHGESEVVVPVERQLRGDEPLLQSTEEPPDPGGRHHADRVADHGPMGPRLGAGIVQVDDEIQVRAERVLRDERDRDAVGDGIFGLADGDLFHLLPRHAELVPDVEVRAGGEKRDLVDAAIDARLDVLPDRPGGRHDRRVEPRVRDRTDGARLLLRDDGNPDVHDGDVDLVEESGDLDLLLRAVGDARRLLAIAEGLLPDLDFLGQVTGEAFLDQVVVDQAFLRDGRSPVSSSA